jgi:isopentenyl phosphate kinase
MQFVMYIIKFGGSVITEKASEKSIFKTDIMDGLTKSLVSAGKEYIIVHGAGSFGHVLAKKYDLHMGFLSDTQKIGVALTQMKVQQLNNLFLQSLHKYNIPAISISPHVTLTLHNHKVRIFHEEIFSWYLSKGFVPVTYGDVVLDTSLGFSICSGDLLIELLVEQFQPEKVIFIIDEDGLYDDNPKINPQANFLNHISSKDIKSLTATLDKHADVTGGMKGKLETITNILRHDVDVILLNGNKPERLYNALIGNKIKFTLIKR